MTRTAISNAERIRRSRAIASRHLTAAPDGPQNGADRIEAAQAKQTERLSGGTWTFIGDRLTSLLPGRSVEVEP